MSFNVGKIPNLSHLVLSESSDSESRTTDKHLIEGLPLTEYALLNVLRTIGTCSFGRVSLCERDRQLLVFKEMIGNKDQKRLFIKEAKLLHEMHHRNVVRFHSFCNDNGSEKMGIILEYVTFDFKPFKMDLNVSSLLDYLRFLDKFKCKGFEHLHEFIAKDVCAGLFYLHEHNCAHRDLKPSNVLVSNQHYLENERECLTSDWKTKPIVARLTDFGESRSSLTQTASVAHTQTTNILRGTPVYMAPEIFNPVGKQKMDLNDLKKADIWSYAMILFNMLNPDLKTPYALDFKEMGANFFVLKQFHDKNQLPTHSKRYISERRDNWSHLEDVYRYCATYTNRPSILEVQARLEKDIFEEIPINIVQSADVPHLEDHDASFCDNATLKEREIDSQNFVAAIDVGCTHSGYAFSSRCEYESSLAFTRSEWKTKGSGLETTKTPSALLVTPNKDIHSFGYDAEDKYWELKDKKQHEKWYFFDDFKMILQNNKEIRRSTLARDRNGKTMPTIKVLSMAIRYLKTQALQKMSEGIENFQEANVHWVLTVPAQWHCGTKQFVREAAQLAGIKHENLSLAFESEAASISTIRAPVDTITTCHPNISFEAFETGQLYLVVDIGGKTTDLAVHEVLPGCNIKEISRACSIAIGGTCVDDGFFKFLDQIFGNDILEEIKEKSMSDYIHLCREFEREKRNFKGDPKEEVIICLPPRVIALFYKAVCKNKSYLLSSFSNNVNRFDHIFGSYFSSFGLNDHVKIIKNKMFISAKIFKAFFKEALLKITFHTRYILTSFEREIPIILLVGGLSDCREVKEAFQTFFKNKLIISPKEANLSVLRGAVLYGHNPDVIQSRIMQYTYGVEYNQCPFEAGKHPEVLKKWLDNRWVCSKCFGPFVRANEEILVGSVISKIYQPDTGDATDGIGIYISSSTPKYTTSCNKLGCIILKYPEGGWPVCATLKVDMQFGGTEFTVSITDSYLNETYTACYDFLKP